MEPIVRVGGVYDDNATLNIRTDQEVELSGLLFDASAGILYGSDRTNFDFTPRVIVRRFDESNFDSDDFFLSSAFEHVAARAGTFGFRTRYDTQTVRTAERATSDLDVEDPDEITEDDTGRVILEGTRDRVRFSPYWNKRLSDVSMLRTRVDYIDVGYDDVLTGTLVDYDDARLSVTYARGFSDVNTAIVTATGRTFDTSAVDRDLSGFGVMAGFNHKFSENTDVTAMVGFEESDQPGSSIDPTVVGELTLIRRFETIRMFARYKRSVNSSGAGLLSVRDALNVSFRRRLSEKLTAGLGIRAYQTGSIDGAISLDDREYVQLQSNFQLYLSRSMLLEMSYRYTISDRSTAIGERANSNQVNVWFVYQPRTVPRI